jgi:predicted phage tail protein
MRAPEGLDIRAPIGGLFTVLGGMLAGYGLFASGSRGASEASSGVNVNLWWGLVMLVFGIVLLLLARRATSRPAPAPE